MSTLCHNNRRRVLGFVSLLSFSLRSLFFQQDFREPLASRRDEMFIENVKRNDSELRRSVMFV